MIISKQLSGNIINDNNGMIISKQLSGNIINDNNGMIISNNYLVISLIIIMV